MWSSDLSLALTSDSHDEDGGYAFVGKRKKTPLTIIPLGRYKPPRPSRTDNGRRKGDEALRYAQREASGAYNFPGFRELSSTSLAQDPPINDSTLSPVLNERIAVIRTDDQDPQTPPDLQQYDPPEFILPPRPPDGLLSRCLMPSLPPPANPDFRTSAFSIGTNHARAVLCLNRLKTAIDAELLISKQKTDLEPLRRFSTEHAQQLELWTDALIKWNTFIKSLFPKELEKFSSVPLSRSDGELLLAVLPPSTTIAYCEWSQAAALNELGMTPSMQKLLSVQGVAEKAVSLAVCLKVLEAANCARRYFSVVEKVLDEFSNKASYKRLIKSAREMLIETGGEEGEEDVSIWSILMLIAVPANCEKLVKVLIAEDLFAELRSAPLDELLDLIEQVDLEIVLEQIRLYILSGMASISQSVALLRVVSSNVRSFCNVELKRKTAASAALDTSLRSVQRDGQLSGSDTTIYTESTRAGSEKHTPFCEKFVQHRIRKLHRQVQGLQLKLRQSIIQSLSTTLGIKEAKSYSTSAAAQVPVGTLLKTLVIVIETVRNCSRSYRLGTRS